MKKLFSTFYSFKIIELKALFTSDCRNLNINFVDILRNLVVISA